MQNRTELMESILTSETAQRIIDYVTPKYGESYVCLWLFQVIGAALDEVNSFPGEFIEQITPETATWTLGFWEQEYGIKTDDTLSIEQRRANIMNKIAAKVRMNPWNMKNIIKNITGHTATIEENTGKNKFTVNTHGNDTLSDELRKLLISTIETIKPAHLIYNIKEFLVIEDEATINTNICCSTHEIIEAGTISCPVIILTDEEGNILTDEQGNVFIY